MATWRLLPLLALGSATACGVQRIEDASERSLPAEVIEALDASCNVPGDTGCHAGNAGGVTFDGAGAFSSQPQMVVPGNTQDSLMSQRILGGTMPPSGFSDDRTPDRYVIVGWIAAGAPLEDAATGGGSSSSTGTNSTADASGSETGTVDYDAFVSVLDILAASCGGETCHRDGGTLSPVPIPGYITDGGLVADLKAHFAEQTPHQDVAPSTDLEAFMAGLPEAALAQLKAFDALVREAKQWRDLDGFALHYGYDLAADGVEVELDGENVVTKIFTLGNDYGGNVFMMLPDGTVGIWSHDEGMVEDHNRFESLEQCLWTMLHCDLVKNQKMPLGPVKAVLEGFDEDTGPTWCLEDLVEYLEDEGLL